MPSAMGQEMISVLLGLGLGIALNQIRNTNKRLDDVEDLLAQIVNALKNLDEEEQLLKLFCLYCNTILKNREMKKYTKQQNAFYWAVTTVFAGIGIATMMVVFALVERITA